MLQDSFSSHDNEHNLVLVPKHMAREEYVAHAVVLWGR